MVPIPAPEVLHDEEGWVDYSYVNHLVTNGGVIACTFDDPMDAEAAAAWLLLDLERRTATWQRAAFDPAPARARARDLGLDVS